MKNKLIVAACLLFLFSRIIFINTQPLFFDSSEYIKAFAFPNLFDAIIAVHFPLHDGYIWLLWPLYQLGKLLSVNPISVVILGQIVLALCTVFFFYKIISFLSDSTTAAVATIIISLTPLFWITNVTILYETGYVFLFFMSLYFLTQHIITKKLHFLHLAAFFLPLAIFTHMMLILWLPFYFSILFLKAKKQFLQASGIILFYFIVLTIVRTIVVDNISHYNLSYVIDALYFRYSDNTAVLHLDLHSFLISLRNFFIPLMRGYTSLVTILAVVSLFVLLFRNKIYVFYAILWVGPAFLALQFWEAQLPGRYAIIAGFGIAFLAALLIKNNRIAIVTVIVYLFFVSIPAMQLLRSDIPYLKLAEYTASLPSDSLLIESHFSRPQVQDYYKGRLVAINEPQNGIAEVQREIDTYVTHKKDVFISSAAMTDPYGLYSGPYLHILSLSYNKPGELQSILPEYTMKEHSIISKEDNIVVYKILAKEKSKPPHIPRMKDHYRRIDYYDPLWRIYRLLTNL